MNERKELKSLASVLMEQEGISYEDWLYQQHMNFVAENSKVLIETLKKTKEK